MQKSIKITTKAIEELERLGKTLKAKKTYHVNEQGEKFLIKATAHSWLNSHRTEFISIDKIIDLSGIDNNYCKLMDYSDNRTKRNSYLTLIKNIKSDLIILRSEIVKKSGSGELLNSGSSVKPKFSVLIPNPKMVLILERRWIEIENCLNNKAPLAATVMMGGLLESVLMARINTLADKSSLFIQKSTPRDRKTNIPKQLSEWMLKDFIDVSSEIKLITKPLAAFSRNIRDYRNYVHPEKELRMDENIEIGDAKLFWKVTVNLIEQLLTNP